MTVRPVPGLPSITTNRFTSSLPKIICPLPLPYLANKYFLLAKIIPLPYLYNMPKSISCLDCHLAISHNVLLPRSHSRQSNIMLLSIPNHYQIYLPFLVPQLSHIVQLTHSHSGAKLKSFCFRLYKSSSLPEHKTPMAKT